MTVSHAHARNACAHEQSTNIESGAVQWHKQLAERATFATKRERSEPTPSRQSAELWHEHLSVYGLIAKIFCAVSSETSLMWLSSVRGTRIDVATMTTFSRKTALLPQAKCMRFHPLVILSNVEGSSEAKRKKQRAVCA